MVCRLGKAGFVFWLSCGSGGCVFDVSMDCECSKVGAYLDV